MRRNHQIFTGESGFAQTGAKQSEAEMMKPEPASCAELMLEKNAAEIQIR